MLSNLTPGYNKKMIALRPSNVNAIVYTVPTGKTFTGDALANSQIDFTINGVTAISLAGAPTNEFHRIPLKLTEGTVVRCGPSYQNWTLLGIEE